MEQEVIKHTFEKSTVNDNTLQLSEIKVNEDYRKAWNITLSDFVCLTRNGNLLSPSLYRIGGLNTPDLKNDKYFMLLKQVEAYYSDNIIKDPKRKPHLDSRWCIIDFNGVEKIVIEEFKYASIIEDSCVYSVDRKYYNIETDELYCQSFSCMHSNDFIFLENKYDDDKSKRGVIKIDKKTGAFELFK